MMKRTMSFLGVAGCVLAAGSLYATNVTNTFDTADIGSWLGDCARAESNYTFSAASTAGFPTGKGYPLSENYILTVEGVATNASVSGTSLVDMMVQAARPDEDLELSEEDAGNVHIAVAVDSEGYFNAYCKTNATESGWCRIASAATAEDAWVRVSLLFDYTAGFCQIRINGEPVMSNFGYLTTKADTTVGGAWYKLASGSSVSLVKVVGCTAIDEFVLNDATTTYALAANATNAQGVSCAWLDQNGLGWDTTQSYDSSTKTDGTAMTVADKYKYCFGPFDGQGEADFAVKSISTTAEKVTLALPATVANGGRQVVVDYGTDKNFGTGTYDTTEEVTGESTVQIDVPAPGNVIYYRLRATDK